MGIVDLDHCPKCNHKSVRYRSIADNYYCNHCNALFNKDFEEIKIDGVKPLNLLTDGDGNYYSTKTEKKEDKIIFSKIYYLEKGKTTLKGSHNKLREDSKCKYPQRLDCNGGIGYTRCEYMEYGGGLGNWFCKYEVKKGCK